MSYRKKNEFQFIRKWKNFLDRNKELILVTGLPLEYYMKQELFEDFMMHGYIDHHIVESNIAIDHLNEYQINKLKIFTEAFFEYGFLNPGIIVFNKEFLKYLKSKYPASFNLLPDQ